MISLKLCDDGNPVILNADMNNTEKSAKASTKKVGSKAKRETKLKEKQIEKPRPIPPQVNQPRVLYKQFKVERTVRVRLLLCVFDSQFLTLYAIIFVFVIVFLYYAYLEIKQTT